MCIAGIGFGAKKTFYTKLNDGVLKMFATEANLTVLFLFH